MPPNRAAEVEPEGRDRVPGGDRTSRGKRDGAGGVVRGRPEHPENVGDGILAAGLLGCRELPELDIADAGGHDLAADSNQAPGAAHAEAGCSRAVGGRVSVVEGSLSAPR